MQRTGDLKLIQELNRSIILRTIRHYGPISRSEIAKKNKISPTTVTAAVKELIRQGLVYEDGIGVSTGGRKPVLVRFSSDSKFIIAVAITNSSIKVAEMNLEAKVRRQMKEMVEKQFKLKTWLENDANAIALAEKRFGAYRKFKNLIYITIGDCLL
jgi:predicted NBD/HSP70 family sugar kinase